MRRLFFIALSVLFVFSANVASAGGRGGGKGGGRGADHAGMGGDAKPGGHERARQRLEEAVRKHPELARKLRHHDRRHERRHERREERHERRDGKK